MPSKNSSQRSVLLFSHETTLSGAPLALFYLACWLKDHETPPVVAAPERGPISQLLERRGIETVIDDTFLTDPTGESLNALCGRFDIVVANTLASWPMIRAARKAGATAIWYLHETLVAVELMEKIPEMRATLDQAHLIITPTRQTARLYEGITRTRIQVVPYGIPRPEVSSTNRNRGPLKFLCLGSYERRKGQDILLDAIAALSPETQRQVNFDFAGRVLDDNFFAALKARASRLKNVQLGPALEHAGSLQVLAESDVLVCSSRDETMPISIIEAMALGKMVISTDVGGIAEWLRDEMNGLLVPPNEWKELASAIEQCANDGKLRSRCGENARRTFARHFSFERFGKNFAAAIRAAELPKPAHDYEQWVKDFDSLTASERIALRRRLRALRQHPRISILLPIYNPDLKVLAAAIESVKRQLYQEWEVCLADDASTHRDVHPFLSAIAASDSRIKLTFRATNGHISAASNSSLALATGEWCALLDQDDELAEHALAMVALEIAAHPEARVIYSDEDKLDSTGRRSDPFFKPDWNPELFNGQNFLNHLGVYETKLLREVGGFREGYEGSQDYDVASRCIDRIRENQVRHIPRILYHWRSVPGSLAELPDAKPYAREAARRVLNDHLRRNEIAGRAEPCPENDESHRVIYALPDPPPLVTIIIPTRDRVELLRRCVESVRGLTSYPAFELLIVDNDSTDPETLRYFEQLEAQGAARILREPGPFSFSRVNNAAVPEARGEILAFLNNDIEVTEPNWLGEMVSHAVRPEVGAVGARLWCRDGTLQHGGVVLGLGGVAGHAHYRVPRGHPGYFNRAFLQQNCAAVTAACMLTRKALFEERGGFNERELAVNFNDIDYCLRVRARGLQVVWTPYANLIHDESGSRGHHAKPEEREQFCREADYMQKRYGEELLHDPFYNPNLSLTLPGYEIAFPPRVRSVS